MILIHFLVAMIATFSFAVIYNAPKKELVFCGFTGALGWIIYYGMTSHQLNSVVAAVIATTCLTIFARLFAVARKHPVTVYLLPGIFPLVPGAGIYYTAYHLFNDNNALSAAKGIETFEIACAIVFGIIFGFALPQSLFHKIGQLFHNNKRDCED